MEKIAESIGNMALLSKLRDIPRMTLKFVATNQSLYVYLYPKQLVNFLTFLSTASLKEGSLYFS